ncbi:hypothetical protein D3272_25940 [Lichenibacterium ramalinae]|uniref:Uncharacterized protein n=1 Tax=Lichenibacterium ramalinae TaxID=2316527 RepID=A0A4Q2R9E6_9HYPH|nr:hypothetical protein D3272_25940 [Lichenibacterium ramalinae]
MNFAIALSPSLELGFRRLVRRRKARELPSRVDLLQDPLLQGLASPTEVRNSLDQRPGDNHRTVLVSDDDVIR